MHLSQLDFPPEIISILETAGISELNPPQVASVKAGLFNRKNIVVAAPTASGKTLIAELAFLKNFLRNGKTVYLVPLKALASEKYTEFKEKYESIGMKVAIAVGDMDSEDSWLKRYDLIIASNEKMDSMLRHNADWISDISLIVSDEVHLLNDATRGPTLEIVLTRLRALTNAQIIALSATIKNADEIADWLGAAIVKSDYRPVKLHTGIFYRDGSARIRRIPQNSPMSKDFSGNPSYIEFLEKDGYTLQKEGENEAVLSADTLEKDKQALMFLSTRSSAEAAAEKISKVSEKFLSAEEKKKLGALSDEVLEALSNPTKQCKRLSSLLRHGVAFHHAGLVAKQRKIIEDAFRSGLVKILTATPTLSFGVNLPAWRVLIRDTKRFSGYGADYIPVLEIQQMFGRAGRPKYDNDGEAILIAKSSNDAKELWNRYILGDPEPIYSKLSVEPVLRMHVLALIASGVATSKSHLENFFSKTFFAHQYGDLKEVMLRVEKIMKELESYRFIRIGEENFISSEFTPAFDLGNDVKLTATKIGKRVSELYLDPQSADFIIQNFQQQKDIRRIPQNSPMPKEFSRNPSCIEYLLAINQCAEMKPLLHVTSKEYDSMEEEMEVSGLSAPVDKDYDEFLAMFKTSLMFHDWMSEVGEDVLLERYGVTPGELYTKLSNAEWLLYAASELAQLLNKREIANTMNNLRLRARYGVKDELLPLVRLKNIGRTRARMLYKNAIKSFSDIKSASIEKLEKILGRSLAKQLKERAEEDMDTKMRRFKMQREP